MSLIMRPLFRNSVCLVLLAMTAFSAHSGRTIRALAFRKGSTFFYRLNYKINSFPYTRIFAQAAGFKAAWELPTGGLRIVRSVSDIREHAELVYESHGFNGRSCLLKSICQVSQYTEGQDGVIRKILKLLTGSYINNGTWHEDPLLCERHVEDCPLQLIGLNSFAEDAV
ncbi:PREDICTED: uncharacterized protein LOC106742314 [Dinoponera quadriceps]|uniref:Uncharacterized protein LOC106742314 n=1 Tax=Dinoponera quadriceps TaxID=609295 RepID=A0A6P3WYD6_DINQU|nr:PREDICTED: uncharacterized protein LOC106742314 [Dinoponera quadriceps]